MADARLTFTVDGKTFVFRKMRDPSEAMELFSKVGGLKDLKARHQTLKQRLTQQAEEEKDPTKELEFFDTITKLDKTYSAEVSMAVTEAMRFLLEKHIEGDLAALKFESASELLGQYTDAHFVKEEQGKN